MKNPVNRDQWIRAGRLIDGKGGPVLKDRMVHIAGGRIAGIEAFDPNHPGHGTAMDLSHTTLLPPLIDAHVHLALSGTRHRDRRTRQLSPTADQAAATISAHLARYARSGILAVRDGGDRYGHVLGHQHSVLRDTGSPVQVCATCWAWHARGRYGRMIGRSPGPGTDLVQALAGIPDGMGHLKLIHSGLNSLDRFGHCGPPQFNDAQLQAAVALAHRTGMPVMVHANGETAVRQAIAAGCDSIEHGYFMGEDNLARLADTGCVWVPTVIPMAALAGDPSLSPAQRDIACRIRDHQLDQVRRGHRLGVRIVLGTDAGSVGVDHATAVPREMALLSDAGLCLEQVVRCATGRAARLLGLADPHVIAPGERAGMVVMDGDSWSMIGESIFMR